MATIKSSFFSRPYFAPVAPGVYDAILTDVSVVLSQDHQERVSLRDITPLQQPKALACIFNWELKDGKTITDWRNMTAEEGKTPSIDYAMLFLAIQLDRNMDVPGLLELMNSKTPVTIYVEENANGTRPNVSYIPPKETTTKTPAGEEPLPF